MSREGYRCEMCGKFVSYKSIEKEEVIIEFIPDTVFTVEEYKFKHKNCNDNQK